MEYYAGIDVSLDVNRRGVSSRSALQVVEFATPTGPSGGTGSHTNTSLHF